MSFKVIPKAVLPDWVEQMRRNQRVVGPKPLHGQHIFGDIQSAAEIDLDYPTTVIPPKKYLFPQQEDLLTYRLDGSPPQVVQDAEPTVVLGLHTCDLHALHLLDRVFAQTYVDQPYMARREKTTLVSIECLRPCMSHSFCKSMGTLSVTDGFDLHLTDLGDDYAVDVGTPKGAALLQGLRGVRDASDEDSRRVNRVMTEKWPRFPLRLDFDVTELPSLLSVSYDSKLWDELGERCLACAMCTNVCPTCYCFNVADEAPDTGCRQTIPCLGFVPAGQVRHRADGHNFRGKRAARQRHRFLRKGKYQTDAFGLLGCVGCGRCAQACLVDITPVDTFNELNRRRHRPASSETKEVAA
jgi:formate hydrogenlyase subunit 6/NADH:ubiquinone oxidoreductase subunit I